MMRCDFLGDATEFTHENSVASDPYMDWSPYVDNMDNVIHSEVT